jgi:hypothetical protein
MPWDVCDALLASGTLKDLEREGGAPEPDNRTGSCCALEEDFDDEAVDEGRVLGSRSTTFGVGEALDSVEAVSCGAFCS